MHTQKFDIIIVGGGITGCTLALALAQATQLRIALLEANTLSPTWDEYQYHHRVSALTLASRQILHALQVWPVLASKRLSPFRQISIWDNKANTQLHFAAEEINQLYLGYIVENNLLQQTLLAALQHYAQVQIVPRVQLQAMTMTAQDITLKDQTTSYTAKLAIAADGSQSWLRQHSGITCKKIAYQAAAIVAHVQTALPHAQVARQVFTPDGPVAFLPLQSAQLSSIVWSLPIAKANKLLASNEEEFKYHLHQAFGAHLGNIITVFTRYTFPLYFQQAEKYVQERVVLVGDAAHQVHPLAGQGVNMGLLDVAALRDVLLTTLEARRDFSHIQYLKRYERWRKADNQGLLLGIEWIRKLFATEQLPITTLRGCGLQLTEQLRFIKQLFIQHAVGNHGRVPQLAKLHG